MTFILSSDIDHEKIFLVKTFDLDKRLDPFFYIPALVKLDNLIKSKTPFKLSDFALSYSSGATPSKDNADFYSDKENGIPFIRVQNLSITGILSLDDLIYISPHIHDNMLKRSRISAGDLLVKITGVGRMAIASVVPDGFEGNINQHIVVIKTQSKEISENLAAFINLDTVEKLASKRSAGGTRPALDYAALFSLPVINNRDIHNKISEAVSLAREKKKKSNKLLNGIDTYLLSELGITAQQKEDNNLKQRIFMRNYNDVMGKRLDVFFNKPVYIDMVKLLERHSCKKLRYIVSFSTETWDQKSIFENFFPYLEISGIDLIMGEISEIESVEIENAPSRAKMIVKFEDIVISTTRPNRGAIAMINSITLCIASTGFAVIRDVKNFIDRRYLYQILRNSLSLRQMEQRSSGGNYPAITLDELGNILIPVPPLEKQWEIVAHIAEIRQQAKQLREEAETELSQVKAEVERMILGQ